jgi:hypothetical protein
MRMGTSSAYALLWTMFNERINEQLLIVALHDLGLQ